MHLNILMTSRLETALLRPEKKCRKNIPMATWPVPSGQVAQRPDHFSPPPLEPWVIWGLTGQRPDPGKVHSQSLENTRSQAPAARAGPAWRLHRSRSRASWVTVRRPMENNCSQGSRIQASRGASCSGHTTRSAQKLSSRDTWQTKSGSETPRAAAEKGQGGPREDHCPLLLAASLPRASVTPRTRC